MRSLISSAVAIAVLGAFLIAIAALQPWLFPENSDNSGAGPILATDSLGYMVIEFRDGSDVYVADNWIGSWVLDGRHPKWVGGSVSFFIADIVFNDPNAKFRISLKGEVPLEQQEWLMQEIYEAYPEGQSPPPIPGSLPVP